MKWFGSTSKSKKGKNEPLIESLHALGSEGADDKPVDRTERASAGDDEATLDHDAHIPAKRVSSGEKNMILPKHLKRNLEGKPVEEDSIEDRDYIPLEVNASRNEDSKDDNDTAVASAISLSTIGASIDREVQQARSTMKSKSQPPLEIKATKKQKIFKKGAAFWMHIPDAIMNGLSSMFDTIHGGNKQKNSEKSLDDVPVTARRYKRDHPDLLLPGNVPRVGFTACFAAIPVWIKFLMVGGVAAAALTGAVYSVRDTPWGESFFDMEESLTVDWNEEKSIAFVGNSYLYVNDIPRLMQKISAGRIHQDSCLRTSASLGKLLRAGNGMYEMWQTQNAITYKFNTEWSDSDDPVYDFGSCSVFQLLEGYDNDLSYKNYNGAYYYDEGTNPCFEDSNYLIYLQDRNLKDPQYYEYIVINDQTARMANGYDRQDSINALKYAYAPMFKDAHAVPLIVDTHAYPMEFGTNITAYSNGQYNEAGGETIPYMQALMYYGVEEYIMALKYNLPSYQAPKVVPIGMAYLVVWEESFENWQNLFLNNTVHASPHGSYLFANVLYATVYGHLPRRPTSVSQIKKFFSTARYMPEVPEDAYGLWPTVEESDYLRLVARRVSLQGYIPQSYTDARAQIKEEIEAARECACANNNNNNNGQQQEEGQEGEEDQQQQEDQEDCECANNNGGYVWYSEYSRENEKRL